MAETCGPHRRCVAQVGEGRKNLTFTPIEQAEALNRLACMIHHANRRWWHTPEGVRLSRNTGELLMLVVSEIAEAMEGHRKGLMDDHLSHRKMFEVELADAMIRIFDLAGRTTSTSAGRSWRSWSTTPRARTIPTRSA